MRLSSALEAVAGLYSSVLLVVESNPKKTHSKHMDSMNRITRSQAMDSVKRGQGRQSRPQCPYVSIAYIFSLDLRVEQRPCKENNFFRTKQDFYRRKSNLSVCLCLCTYTNLHVWYPRCLCFSHVQIIWSRTRGESRRGLKVQTFHFTLGAIEAQRNRWFVQIQSVRWRQKTGTQVPATNPQNWLGTSCFSLWVEDYAESVLRLTDMQIFFEHYRFKDKASPSFLKLLIPCNTKGRSPAGKIEVPGASFEGEDGENMDLSTWFFSSSKI